MEMLEIENRIVIICCEVKYITAIGTTNIIWNVYTSLQCELYGLCGYFYMILNPQNWILKKHKKWLYSEKNKIFFSFEKYTFWVNNFKQEKSLFKP